MNISHEIITIDDTPSCVKLTIDGKEVVIWIAAGLGMSEVQSRITDILSDEQVRVSDDMRLWTSKWCEILIGTTVYRKVVPLTWKVILWEKHDLSWPSSRLQKDGTIWKSEWRFKMSNFAWDIFSTRGLEDTHVLFLPGTWFEEIKIWRRLWANERDMIMVEGDASEHNVLSERYLWKENSPQIINTLIWNEKSTLWDTLDEINSAKKTTVVSLDTEVSLTQWIYDEILQIFERIEVGDDIFFMLNIVRRWAKNFYEKFEIDNQDPIEFCMNMLMGEIIHRLWDDNFHIEKSNFWTYLWWSSTPMSYVMCHIKKV